LPAPSTKAQGPVRKWIKGKLTVEVLDEPDSDFPKDQTTSSFRRILEPPSAVDAPTRSARVIRQQIRDAH